MRLFLLAAGLAVLAGCGDGGPATGKMTGEVKLDGKPVDAGTIRFVALDGKSPPAEGAITAGKYSVDAPVGEARVEISAMKVTGSRKMYDTPDSPKTDVTTDTMPAKYNTKSELKAKVVRGTNPPTDFDLKSK